jgi:starch synthase (maltosyl-transferring)
VIESVRPQVDGGRYPVKRALGEEVLVEADVFADGHDQVVCHLLWRFQEDNEWKAVAMEFRHNDHWAAAFTVEKLGRYQYKVRGWVDPFVTWRRDLAKRRDAGQDLSVDFLIGSGLVRNEILADEKRSAEERYQAAMSADVPPPAREAVVESDALEVLVDPVKARFSAWYEMFPRSARGDLQGCGRAATLRAGDGLRRALLSADPSDRHDRTQGQEQRRRGQAGRGRQPLGNRRQGGRAQGHPV